MVRGHFLAGSLKEAGEARKGATPCNAGTRQRPAEWEVAQGESQNGRTQTGQNRSCRAPAPSEATVNTQVPAQRWIKLVQPRPKRRVGRPEGRWGTGLTLSNVAATCYIWLLKLTEIKYKTQFLSATFQMSSNSTWLMAATVEGTG